MPRGDKSKYTDKQERKADLVAVAFVAKAAHHAVGSAPPLDLQHGALAGAVGQIDALGDNAVERCVSAL